MASCSFLVQFWGLDCWTEKYPEMSSIVTSNNTTTNKRKDSKMSSPVTLNGAEIPSPAPKRFKPETECVSVRNDGDPYNAASVPLYQTATFKQTSATDMGQFDYTRSGNPTRSALEVHLAKLMRCDRAFAVSTGMSALDAVLRLARAGDEIVAGDDLYGGTNRLLTHMKNYLDITVHHVDTTDNAAVLAVLHPTKTKFVLLESPTNPCIKICDIRAISEMVRSVCSPETLVVVDNTMMSPLLMNCFELGADIEYHSGTKFLSGHHDLMAGVIGVKCPEVSKRIYFVINSIGSGLAPFDCFLLLRGIKTLALRVERQQSNAEKVARAVQDLGFRVRYPGLESHPQRALHMSMAKGGGAVMSFTTGDVQKSVRIVEACRLWGISVSFGCVNSLISMPCHMSHASIPAHVREERGLSDDLIRLCVGIEDVDDLIDDLKAAIHSATVESAIKGGDR